MYFGVDYHPEQWVYPYSGTAERPEAAWERDVELMQNAGINVVRMGEFIWGLCEREEGKYDFSWLKRVMDLMGKAGIQVVLATPTAAPPVWLTRKHPEIPFNCNADKDTTIPPGYDSYNAVSEVDGTLLLKRTKFSN